ncbi:hypothetical protein MRB53_014075 [Persea americana]|uniref:Uncharacterized protein n=1 Tax=Persea americana TaxID=3435 RepID=A0ACC2K9R4_PERAE|nr:hypothetical protein MRB53_014075 [Persea americana]
MILAASVFLIGSIINGAAENVWMLIGGRLFHGIGIGFVIQVAPMNCIRDSMELGSQSYDERSHAFLPALCHLKFFLFFIFAGVLAISTLLIYFFVPETKDIPIEQVSNFWKEHWYWSRFFSNEEGQTA